MERTTSTQPRKQRKWVANAPLHKRHSLVTSNLSKDLREKHKRRSLPVRKGDKVRITRGDDKGMTGEVSEVSLKDYTIFVAGVTTKKAGGAATPKAIDPSNVVITELVLEDKERRDILERKTK